MIATIWLPQLHNAVPFDHIDFSGTHVLNDCRGSFQEPIEPSYSHVVATGIGVAERLGLLISQLRRKPMTTRQSALW
jgi:hypothetical protein